MIKIISKRKEWRIYKMFTLFKIRPRLLLCYKRKLNNFVDEFLYSLLEIIKTIAIVIISPIMIIYHIVRLLYVVISALTPTIVYFNGSEEDLNYDYDKAEQEIIDNTRTNLND